VDATDKIQTSNEDSGKRERPRDSMYLQATLRPRGGAPSSPAFTVKVRNISAGGLMGQSDQPVTMRDHIVIELRNIGEVGGTVAWVKDDWFGVVFDRTIDPKLARRRLTTRAKPEISSSGFRKATHPLG